MKVYVVQEDWASRLGGSGHNILGVYADEDQAKEALKRAVKQAKEDGLEFDTVNLDDDDYYEAYDDGWYDTAHYRARIEYLRVHERRNK